jgi:hypothetical protein
MARALPLPLTQTSASLLCVGQLLKKFTPSTTKLKAIHARPKEFSETFAEGSALFSAEAMGG